MIWTWRQIWDLNSGILDTERDFIVWGWDSNNGESLNGEGGYEGIASDLVLCLDMN